MRLLISTILLLYALNVSADTVLINNKLSTQKTLRLFEVQAIFMLKHSYWNNGAKIIPVFIDFDNEDHIKFVSNVLKISPINFDIIMQDKIQQGDSWQYIMVQDSKAAAYAVSKTPGAIAYIPSILVSDIANIQIIKVSE